MATSILSGAGKDPGTTLGEAIIEIDTIAERLASLSQGIAAEAERRRNLGAFARSLHNARRLRTQAFDADLFGEAIWDMLLDLYACESESRPVSVSNACLAADVPPTTALRYLTLMRTRGLVERFRKRDDMRVSHVRLTATAKERMERLLFQMRIER